MASVLTRYAHALAKLPLATDAPRLMDVGCSGGIDKILLEMMPGLKVDGFDPLVEEVGRLNGLNLPGHSYWNYFVGAPARENSSNSAHENSQKEGAETTFHLTSAHAAQEVLRLRGTSYTQEIFNAGASPTFTDNWTNISEFIRSHGKAVPNFLKVDTDGHDYFVLEGAGDVLESNDLFGVQVECQFHGTPGLGHNTFSSIDELLRSKGFSLFVLETHKYSRADLPQPFVWNLFAQTISGQIQWGEAVYFRDPTIDDNFRNHLAADENALVNFLRFLLYFDLPDMVAATINSNRSQQGVAIEWAERVLDEIVPTNLLGARTYSRYLQVFLESPEAFMPKRAKFPSSQIGLILEALVRRMGRLRK